MATLNSHIGDTWIPVQFSLLQSHYRHLLTENHLWEAVRVFSVLCRQAVYQYDPFMEQININGSYDALVAKVHSITAESMAIQRDNLLCLLSAKASLLRLLLDTNGDIPEVKRRALDSSTLLRRVFQMLLDPTPRGEYAELLTRCDRYCKTAWYLKAAVSTPSTLLSKQSAYTKTGKPKSSRFVVSKAQEPVAAQEPRGADGSRRSENPVAFRNTLAYTKASRNRVAALSDLFMETREHDVAKTRGSEDPSAWYPW